MGSGWRARLARFNAAGLAFFKRRLTVLGAVVAAGAVASAGLGVDTTRNMEHQLFTLLASLLTVAGLANLFWRPRLAAAWRPPRHATAGLPFFAALSVENRGRAVLRGVEASAASPGAAADDTPLPDLPPGASAAVSVRLLPERRGRLRLASPVFLRPDPLGLVRARRSAGDPASVLVLPRRYPVDALALPGRRRHQPGGVTLASSVGESQEFVSLRDYRAGDPLRKIHWRSWAKAGRPIVKECQEEHFVRHALALDTAGPAGAVFEEAVSVAASFAAGTASPDSLLDLLFVGTQAYCFTSGRGLGGADGLLEVLAGVQPRPAKPFKELADSLLRRQETLSGSILVLLGLDDERRAFVRRLRAGGLPTLALVVRLPGAPPLDPEPGVRFIDVGDAARGLAGLKGLA